MHTIKVYYNARLYNNRIIQQDLPDPSYTFENINFISNDGINTVQTLNNINADSSPSYLTATDENNNTTCWYVISSVKNRKNQLTLYLRRDFLDEKWNDIKYAPFIFNKAADISNIAFKYSRYMKTTSMSQIKTGEFQIKDITNGNGWLIGYINKDLSNTDITADLNAYNYDYLIEGDITSWEHYNDSVMQWKAAKASWRCAMGPATGTNRISQLNVTSVRSSALSYNYRITSENACIYTPPSVDYDQHVKAWNNSRLQMGADIGTALYHVLQTHTSGIGISEGTLDEYDNKIIAVKATDGTIRKYRVRVTSSEISDSEFTSTDAQYMYNQLHNKTYYPSSGSSTINPFSSLTINDTEFGSVSITYTVQKLSITTEPPSTVSVNYRQSHTHTQDALFDIFAIPLGGNFKYIDASGTSHNLNISQDKTYVQYYILALVTELYRTWGTELADIQWLPYGPVGDGYTFVQGESSDYPNYNYSLIYVSTSSTPVSIMYWCATAQFQRRISFTSSQIGLPSTLVNSDNATMRIWNEEHMVRLVSPNFASQFEFNPIKNDGLTGFNVYIAYKPYSPYIRVAPIFSGLYGQDYNDDRGLILSGDFSLDRISDAWTQYKLQNKNYQLIFDRQIQSMDLQNELQNRLDRQALVQDVFSAISGTASAAAGGVAAGALAGGTAAGPAGAIIGGVIGGAASAAGGVVDVAVNANNRKYQKAIRDDTRQAAIDQFNYQIGNIQAMPDTITKISTFNPDYKVYPILELYTCTEQEDANYRAAVEWNGYDVDVYASISAVNSGFIRGSILNFDNLYVDQNQALAINDELAAGVYIKEV